MFQDLSIEENTQTKSINSNQQELAFLLKTKSFKLLREKSTSILVDKPYDLDAIYSLYEYFKYKKNDLNQEKCLKGLLKINSSLHFVNKYIDLLIRQGRIKEALDLSNTSFNKVDLSCKEDVFIYYKNCGNIHLNLNNIDLAEDFYNASSKIDPTSDIPLANLGSLYLKIKDYSRAKIMFSQSLTNNSKNHRAWMGLSLCNLNANDSQLFWANIKNAIELCPDNYNYLKLAAQQSIVDYEFSVIEDALKKYIECNPTEFDLGILLCSMLFLQGKFKQLELEVSRLKQIDSSSEDLKKIIELARGVKSA